MTFKEQALFLLGLTVAFWGSQFLLHTYIPLKDPVKDVVSVDLLPSTPLAQFREEDGIMYTTDYLIRYKQQDIDCMTANIFFESRNQSLDGKKLVAKSVMNRVLNGKYTQGKDNTLCNVITAGIKRDNVPVRNMCQYSWYCDGISDRPNLKNKAEFNAWTLSNKIAIAMLNGSMTYDSVLTHYHTYAVSPSWKFSPKMIYINRVGVHLAYNEI